MFTHEVQFFFKTVKFPLPSKTFDLYVNKRFVQMCPFYVLFLFLFSLLFDFVVFRMCTIYSEICALKTPFPYYFYFIFCQMFWCTCSYMFLFYFVICENTFTVTMFYCLHVNIMETNEVMFNVAKTEFRYTLNYKAVIQTLLFIYFNIWICKLPKPVKWCFGGYEMIRGSCV